VQPQQESLSDCSIANAGAVKHRAAGKTRCAEAGGHQASRAEAACASERAIYEAELQQLLTTMLATRALAPQRLHNKAENLHDKLEQNLRQAAATRRRLGS